jgi:HSP20 family protein
METNNNHTPYEQLNRTMSGFMDSFWKESVSNSCTAAIFPKTDILELENGYELHVVLPGIKKEEIELKVETQKLFLSAERKMAQPAENAKYHRVESYYGVYQRVFVLPKNVGLEDIQASYENGVLNIFIPKKQEAVWSHKIQVK